VRFIVIVVVVRRRALHQAKQSPQVGATLNRPVHAAMLSCVQDCAI